MGSLCSHEDGVARRRGRYARTKTGPLCPPIYWESQTYEDEVVSDLLEIADVRRRGLDGRTPFYGCC